jgi:hypothetical protein
VTRIFKVGRYRVDIHRHKGGFAVRSGGRETEWPWREIAIPRVCSVLIGRTCPRSIPHVPRTDRLHLSRTDPTQDVGPCDCPIGVDHDTSRPGAPKRLWWSRRWIGRCC